MNLRYLNADGIKIFKTYLDRNYQASSPEPPPLEILEDSATSGEIGQKIEIDQSMDFKLRADVGEYFHNKIGGLNLEEQKGLWSWLGLSFFDQICKTKDSGRKYEIQRWWYYLYEPDLEEKSSDAPTSRLYRHRIFGPYDAFKRYGVNVGRCLLIQNAYVNGDLVENISSRRDIYSSEGTVEVMSELYCERNPNPGFGAYYSGEFQAKDDYQGNKYRGDMFAFIRYFDQLKMTYDIESMKAHQILELLPAEYNRWKR